MKAYTQLRAITEAFKATGAAVATVSIKQLSTLLDEFDAMRKGKPAAPNDYPDDFEEAWAAYPSRPGASKATTFKAWKARIVAGATPLEMLAGTRKYAAYVLATKTEKQYIKQPATFYGPGEHFSADWTITNGRDNANEEAKRRLFGGFDEFGSTDAPR